MDSLEGIKIAMRRFVAERDWQQFHSPKNLVMALSGEVGELTEHFQWLSENESRHLSDEQKHEVALEIADVQLYLVSLADRLEIDIADSCDKKMILNAHKYPIESSKGRSTKYTKL